jgi:uncharacterized membrane protein YukC
VAYVIALNISILYRLDDQPLFDISVRFKLEVFKFDKFSEKLLDFQVCDTLQRVLDWLSAC